MFDQEHVYYNKKKPNRPVDVTFGHNAAAVSLFVITHSRWLRLIEFTLVLWH